MNRYYKNLKLRLLHTNLPMYVFGTVFAICGVTLVLYSFAASTDDPIGFADYCALSGTNTIIYGWAHDNNSGNNRSLPSVTVALSNGQSTTVSTDIAQYRDSQINSYLTAHGYTPASVGTYGFRAVFSNLYKDTAYGISGTILNAGVVGFNAPLGINSYGGVDGGPLPYFANNQIPAACLADRPSPVVTPPPTSNPIIPPPTTSPKTPAPTGSTNSSPPTTPNTSTTNETPPTETTTTDNSSSSNSQMTPSLEQQIYLHPAKKSNSGIKVFLAVVGLASGMLCIWFLTKKRRRTVHHKPHPDYIDLPSDAVEVPTRAGLASHENNVGVSLKDLVIKSMHEEAARKQATKDHTPKTKT